MKKIFVFKTALILLMALPAQASIINVTELAGASSAGVNASIIAAPAFAQNANLANQAQQGFNEAQGILTTVAHAIDGGGSIAAGTNVNSHMIFLNKANSVGGTLSHGSVEWEFDGIILGVMSDSLGNLEAASTFELGNAGTAYDAPFTARGLEAMGTGFSATDGYTVAGNKITVGMRVTQPGDWIRVVTATAVPVPGTIALMGLGLVGLLGFGRRQRQL